MNRFARSAAIPLLLVLYHLAFAAFARGDNHVTGTPQLSSLPGGTFTIYLDFAGFNYPGTWLGKTPGSVAAFDNATGSFSAAEQLAIKQIWAGVSDAYSMFDVNVTTVDPAVAAGQAGTDANRQTYYDATGDLMHTIIMPNNTWYGSGGGVTWNLGQTNLTGVSAGNHTNWDFIGSINVANNFVQQCAEAAIHENGHGFSLGHQSDYIGPTFVNEYSIPRSYGVTDYGPIMGNSYLDQRGEWRVGDANANPNNTPIHVIQNDISQILSYNSTFLQADGIGHSQGAATPLPLSGPNVNYNLAKGVIMPLSSISPTPTGASNYTSDFFSFQSDGVHPISLTVNDGTEYVTPGTADPVVMLRSTLTILNGALQIVGTGTEAASTFLETFNGVLPAGAYTAQIGSFGGHTQTLTIGGSTANTTNYYDVGSYFVTGSGAAYVWANPVSGSWNTPGNWLSNSRPSAIGASVVINAATTNPLTITLDDPQIVGTLILGNSLSNTTGYTLSAGMNGDLFLNNTGGPSAIIVTGGSHVISAPVLMATNLTVTVSGNSTLTVSGSMAETTSNGLVFGGSGKLILSGNNTYSGGTAVNTGLLQAGSNTALGASTGELGVNSGTFDVHGYSLNVGMLDGGGTIDNRSGNGVLTIGNGNYFSVFSGTMQNSAGQLSLVKQGYGTISTTGNITLSGNITVNGGFLDQSGGNVQASAITAAGSTYYLSSGQLSTAQLTAATSGTLEQIGGTAHATVALVVDGASAMYKLSGGQLSAMSEIVGNTLGSVGNFTQTGGTNSASSDLTVGEGGGGTYSLSGNGRLTVGNNEYIGDYGTGTFMQSGGTHAVSGILYLGNNFAVSGSYSLGGGLVSAANEYVGYLGNGSFTQTGGAHAVTYNLYLGYGASSNGTYTLGSGSLAALDEYIGYNGSGAFTQTGGTNSALSALRLGYNANSSGTYALGGSGLLSVSNELIGYSGSGAVTQTGGIHTLTADFSLGVNASGIGTYNLSGSGQLSSSSDEQIGLNGTGYFTHTGGINAASANLWLGQYSSGYGNYYLANSGQLSVANTEYVGYQGTGIFSQQGGTNSAGSVVLAYSNASTGAYILNGGLLHLASLTQGSGAATFDFTGGTFQAATSFATSVPMNFLQQGNTATFDTNGSTLTLNGALSGPGGMQKGGAGALILAVSNGYTGPTALNAGMLVVSNNGSATGTVTLNGGTLAAAAAGGTIGGTVQFGSGLHTIAPGAALSPVNYGTLNLLGGLTTDLYTRLLFNLNLNTPISGNLYGGDLINLGGSALSVNGGIISFVNTPTLVGDYRLFHNVSGSPNLAAFVLPSKSGESYALSTTVDTGYIDMVVANSVVSSGGTWNVNNSGSWAVGGNWTNSTVPNSGTVAFAGVPGGPSVPLTVALNGNQSAGALVFSVSNGNGYTLSQGSAGALTLGTSSWAAISVLNGAHTISAPLAMAGNMTVSTSSGTSLQIAGAVYEQTPGTSLTLSGAGLMIFSGTGGYTGNTNVSGGTLQITGGRLPAANEHVDASLVQAGGVNAVSGDIYFGTNSSGSGTLSGGNLQCGGNERIGYFVVSSFVQTGGNNSVAATLYVGDAAESQSSYTLSGGGQLTAGNETVGYVSNGAFTQNGGNNAVSANLTLASNNGVFADYFLNSGNLSAFTETVGASGGGSLIQAGGNNTVASTLYVGYYGNGSYSLSGSGQLSAPAEYIGFYSTGSVTQIGGTNSVSSDQTTPTLYLGYNPGSNGIYNLSGSGLLSVDHAEYIGYNGTGSFSQSGGTHSLSGLLDFGNSTSGSGSYNLNSGLLSVTGNAQEYIGDAGSGSFTQIGGTHALSGLLILGNQAGSSGSYDLQGGNIAANAEWVGLSGSGSFSQSGGMNATTILFLGLNGGSGTYNLSGNGQLSALYEYIAAAATTDMNSGTGSFTQTGGTNSAGSLNLASGAGYTGTYNLNGGLLSLTALNQGGGAAAFNFSGGTFQATTPSFQTSVPITLATPGSNGVFDTNGNALTLYGALSGPGGLVVAGAGTLTLAVSNNYTGTTLVSNGTLALANSNSLSGSTFDTSGRGLLSFNGGIGGFAFGGLQGSDSLALTDVAGVDVALTVGGNNTSTTFAGILSDSGAPSGSGGSLIKVGTGTLVLADTNTYLGGTTVVDGTLVIANNEGLADGSSLTVGDATMLLAPVVPAPVVASNAAAVPEPGTAALLIVAAALLAAYCKWR